jgi:hypothetical protein
MAGRRKGTNPQSITRREFVKSTSRAAVGMALGLGALHRVVHGGERIPRVVRAFDINATDWDWVSEYYFDYVDQLAVNRMLFQGIRALTGTRSDQKAWSRLMTGYQRGNKVAIKINCNNYADRSNEIDATAPVLNAVVFGLIKGFGVPEGNIYVYDVSRPIPAFRIRDRVPWGVNFVQAGDSLAQADNDAPIEFRYAATQHCPYVLTQADHLIDLCLFKDHLFVLATMFMKNHYGTPRPGPMFLHNNINYNISDLNATPHIRNKTRLLVGDALFGVWDGGPYGVPMRWDTFPNGPAPNSIFLGTDPVAVESVMVDYLIAEQEYHGVPLLSHDYLHDAMDYHGLGIHEHRDAQGHYQNIDYVELDLT